MLKLDAVVRGYRRKAVLEGVSLDLEPGSCSCLVGGNGAGKTTLLRVVVGLLDPWSGSVSIDGLDPVADRRDYQLRLGYVPAGNGGLYARLTVAQHLAFWADLAFVARAGRNAAIERAIQDLALDSLRDERVDRLSTGQRQRVRLALAFLHDPEVVLLDEPHASLDDDGLAGLAAAIDRVSDRGGSVLWCAPRRAGVALRADREHRLVGGRLA